jgi:hypothetical protein
MPSRKPDGVASLSPILALAAALFGCSAEPQTPPPGGGIHSRTQTVEQCSMFAAMACSAVTLLSGAGAGASTCSAYRASGGGRVEVCGSDPKLPAATNQAAAQGKTYPVRLAWSDNSNNENEFIIERCDQVARSSDGENQAMSCAGEWRRVGTVAANTTTYMDHTALLNRTYLYRVKATNHAGSSNYTGEVSITTPSQ